jgi:Ca2+-transporting ATPase
MLKEAWTKTRWHALTEEETFHKLGSREEGLSAREAADRLLEVGENALPDAPTDGRFRIFLRQFGSPLIYILLIAAVALSFLGEWTDGVIILFVLVLNAVIGAFQEGKAQGILVALRKYLATNALVVRDGRTIIVPDREVVPGDVLVLQEGEKIPADARVVLSNELRLSEAALTGESEPVYKHPNPIDEKDVQLPDRKNMVFRGTHIAAGNGRAVVVTTGISTVIGGISEKVALIDTETPLHGEIRKFSNIILAAVFAISFILVLLGMSGGYGLREMIHVAISLAVSLIPEGLPIVMTLVLAFGVKRMSERGVLVRRLQAVEALGAANVIAVDKTGTITRNEIVVEEISADAVSYVVTGAGYSSEGEVRHDGHAIDPANHPDLLLLGKIAALTSNARVVYSEADGIWQVGGDPTEAAMRVFSEKVGFHRDMLERESPRLAELAFDFRKRYHAALHRDGDGTFLSVVGAPEEVLDLCGRIYRKGSAEPLSDDDRDRLKASFSELSLRGLRVVAGAMRKGSDLELSHESLSDLVFVGLYGMKDALRDGVREAVEEVAAAGMQVVMITGDHHETATAIAKEAGIYEEGDGVLTGVEIDRMNDEALLAALSGVTVFARVTPEHKLRLIEAYKRQGKTIAMTGDGVNDAPSLVAADLGVGMGKIGTEVAKEASDIILLDDNFRNMVAAAEEGRNIRKTIKKVILYLFSTGVGEATVIIGALLLGYPLPLLAVQIIWLNLVTDGFLVLALAMEPKEEHLLSGGTEKWSKKIIDRTLFSRALVMSSVMMVGTLYLFGQYHVEDMTKGWTISLMSLAVFQWFNAWNCRSETRSAFRMNPFSNRYLLGATMIVVALQAFALYVPFMQTLLRTVPLSVNEWLIVFAIASSILFVEEVRKFIYRRFILKP